MGQSTGVPTPDVRIAHQIRLGCLLRHKIIMRCLWFVSRPETSICRDNRVAHVDVFWEFYKFLANSSRTLFTGYSPVAILFVRHRLVPETRCSGGMACCTKFEVARVGVCVGGGCGVLLLDKTRKFDRR